MCHMPGLAETRPRLELAARCAAVEKDVSHAWFSRNTTKAGVGSLWLVVLVIMGTNGDGVGGY